MLSVAHAWGGDFYGDSNGESFEFADPFSGHGQADFGFNDWQVFEGGYAGTNLNKLAKNGGNANKQDDYYVGDWNYGDSGDYGFSGGKNYDQPSWDSWTNDGINAGGKDDAYAPTYGDDSYGGDFNDYYGGDSYYGDYDEGRDDGYYGEDYYGSDDYGYDSYGYDDNQQLPYANDGGYYDDSAAYDGYEQQDYGYYGQNDQGYDNNGHLDNQGGYFGGFDDQYGNGGYDQSYGNDAGYDEYDYSQEDYADYGYDDSQGYGGIDYGSDNNAFDSVYGGEKGSNVGNDWNLLEADTADYDFSGVGGGEEQQNFGKELQNNVFEKNSNRSVRFADFMDNYVQ